MTFTDDETLYPLSHGNISKSIRFWSDKFLEQKELEGSAQKSIKSYKNALKAFTEFVDKYSDTHAMEDIGARYINRFLMEYQAYLAQNKKDDYNQIHKKIINQVAKKNLGKNDAGFFVADEFKNTLLHRQISIKMFLKFVSKNNVEEHDYQVLFHKLIKIKTTENKTEYLTVDELDKVIDLMVKWHKSYREYFPEMKQQNVYRDALLILLYALTGARSEEVVKIRLRDVSEFSSKGRNYYKIKILEAKGGKPREVAVEKDFIETYVEFFKRELPDDSYYLSSRYSNKLKCYINKNYHQDTIRRFGNAIIKDVLGFTHKSGLHLFRRGFATKRIINDKQELAVVAKQLGNSVHVLERYYFKYDAQIAVENE